MIIGEAPSLCWGAFLGFEWHWEFCDLLLSVGPRQRAEGFDCLLVMKYEFFGTSIYCFLLPVGVLW